MCGWRILQWKINFSYVYIADTVQSECLNVYWAFYNIFKVEFVTSEEFPEESFQ